MTELEKLVAQNLEVPKELIKELILEIKEYPEEGTVSVLLRNHQKFTFTQEELAQAERDLETAVTDDNTNAPLPPPISLDEPSFTQQLAEQDQTPLKQGLIVGLGRTSIDRLNEAGIRTVEQLAATNPDDIAEITKQSPAIAKRWREDAANL